MEKIFYKRWTSVLAVVAILVIAILLCILLTQLAQLSSFESRTEKLNALILQARNDKDALNELIEFKKSNEYVIEWAIKNNKINQDDVQFVKDLA